MLRAIFAAWLLLLTGTSLAQQLTLDEATVRKHLLDHPEPVYPPIAKAAHVTGNVVLLVELAPDGRVSKLTADTGPSMLRGAAVEAVKGWTFRPFLSHGGKAAVATKLTIPFTLGPPATAAEDSTASAFFPLSDKCHTLVTARADPAEEAKACRAAAQEAEKFGSGTRFIERRSAYVYAATALMRSNELSDATAFGAKAIAVVAEGHDDDSGASAAFAVRGQAEAFSGNLPAADADLTTAEEHKRKALDSDAGKSLRPEYSNALKNLLRFHAQVLTALKRDTDAAAKTAEADKL